MKTSERLDKQIESGAFTGGNVTPKPFFPSQLDKQIADLREMERTLAGVGDSIAQLRRERDYFKEENQRLQIEVARLQIGKAEAVHALTRVANLNPKCAEIGAGMLATIIADSLTALNKLEVK